VIRRLGRWIMVLLVSIDQLAQVLLAGPKYLIVGGPVPDPDETISSKVGRMAVRGHRWALIAEWLIDGLFELLGDQAGHCRRNIEPRG
jgi:hypothetical protein